MLQLSDVIAEVESGGDPLAERFEGEIWYAWYDGRRADIDRIWPVIQKIHNCSKLTAAAIACTSYGKFQIMGFNLYGFIGVTAHHVRYQNDEGPGWQSATFQTFLISRGINYTLDEIRSDAAKRALFIDRYNGPADTADYWASMQRAIARLSPIVQQSE